MDCYRVPDKFAPTLPTRDWVIHPLGGNPVWTAPVAVVPAILEVGGQAVFRKTSLTGNSLAHRTTWLGSDL